MVLVGLPLALAFPHLLAALSTPAEAASLDGGVAFEVVTLDLAQWDVRVDWTPGGTRLRDVDGAVRTNAGIFEPGFVPSGLLVSDGVVKRPLATGSGEGNFWLKPNGVFFIDATGAHVVATEAFVDDGGVRFATQSGPLLVRHGELHPAFREGSKNRLLRSGVGVVDERQVVLAISKRDVDFFTFARFFRDELHCRDALFLDGVISAMWVDGGVRDAELDKGPFAGVIHASPKAEGRR